MLKNAAVTFVAKNSYRRDDTSYSEGAIHATHTRIWNGLLCHNSQSLDDSLDISVLFYTSFLLLPHEFMCAINLYLSVCFSHVSQSLYS